MDRDKILIIADSINKGSQISSMLPLTRFDDKINVIICAEIESFESFCIPKIIILYADKENILDALNQIKSSAILKNSQIILLLNDNDNELLCSAYDIGIDNFLIGFDETTLFLTVLLMLKTCSNISHSEQTLLMKDVLLDSESVNPFFVYSYKKIANTLNKYLEERHYDYNIMMISPSNERKNEVSETIMSSILYSSIRADDIPVLISDHKFAIIFKTVDESRIKLFYEKLKNKFEELCPISAVSTKIQDNLEFPILYLEKILDENLKSGLEFSYYEDLSEAKYLGDFSKDTQEENFLKNKNAFWKSFSELITPYFFRTRTVMETKFPDSKIIDSINEEETSFLITENGISAELQITYPAFSRINTILSFERNGESKNHKEYYEIQDFNEEKLDELFSELFDGYEMLIHEEANE